MYNQSCNRSSENVVSQAKLKVSCVVHSMAFDYRWRIWAKGSKCQSSDQCAINEQYWKAGHICFYLLLNTGGVNVGWVKRLRIINNNEEGRGYCTNQVIPPRSGFEGLCWRIVIRLQYPMRNLFEFKGTPLPKYETNNLEEKLLSFEHKGTDTIGFF